MAGTPKSVLGQVQTDPMQGYKGVGSYQPNVVGMASGGGFSQYDDPDHTHPEFQNPARRINPPQIPGLLANPNIAPQKNMDELKGLLGTMPFSESSLDMNDWEEDPSSPGLYRSKSDPNRMMMAN